MNLWHKVRKRPGQAMVEFAFVVPMLVLILACVIDFGWVLYSSICIQEACRAGASLAMVDYTTDMTVKTNDIKALIMATSGGPELKSSDIDVNLSPAPMTLDGSPRKSFIITVNYNHALLISPLFKFSTTIPLKSTIQSAVVTGLTL
jgi:Flp pilus assembly protein TadG